MRHQARAVRRVLLQMRACIRHNCKLGDGGTCAWRLKFSFGDVYPYLRDVYHYLTQSRGMRG